MARPTKLTKQVRDAIILAVEGGTYLSMAAEYAGVSRSTLHLWMVRGEAGEKSFSEFSDALKKARANAQVRSIALIRQAANNGTWQAAAWYLERSDPEHWGRHRIEITGAGDAQVAVAAAVDVDMVALEAKIQLLIARQTAKKSTPAQTVKAKPSNDTPH